MRKGRRSRMVIVSGSAGRMSPSSYSTWRHPRICYARCLRDMGAPSSRGCHLMSGTARQGALETFFTISLFNIGNSCSADSQRIFYLHFRFSVIDQKQKMCPGQYSRSFTPPFHEIVEILYFFFRKFYFFHRIWLDLQMYKLCLKIKLLRH